MKALVVLAILPAVGFFMPIAAQVTTSTSTVKNSKTSAVSEVTAVSVDTTKVGKLVDKTEIAVEDGIEVVGETVVDVKDKAAEIEEGAEETVTEESSKVKKTAKKVESAVVGTAENAVEIGSDALDTAKTKFNKVKTAITE